MSRYLEYFEGAFDASVTEKLKPENNPYVAYSETKGMAYTVIPNYVKFTALEDSSSIGFYNNPDSPINPTIEYSFDKNTWSTLTDNVSIEKGREMYCRGLNPNGISGGYGEDGYNYFTGEGKFNVSGDIMSLINYETIPETMIGTFYNLFGGNIDISRDNFVDIVDASNLILSAKTLTDDCYQRMFDSCISMIHGPQIKAEVLAPYCCWGMFIECTSLVAAPELPATTLAKECYSNMFCNCTSLFTAPKLPATTLSEGCYYNMFGGCESLTTVPELPATTLAESCYDYMFYDCTSLTSAPKLPATTLAKSCYGGMFCNCTSLFTAPELPATTLAESCYTSMFRYCTSLTSAPKLPATTLAESCYRSMFERCTSLTASPVLPATELAKSCYFSMFLGCTSLNHITCLATDISASFCTISWVQDVSSIGTFVKHPGMNDWSTGFGGIPSDWTVEDVENLEVVYNSYVTFTAEEDGSSIGLVKLSTNQTLKYSTDTTTWNTFDTTTNISLNTGDKVYVRGMLSADNTSSNYTQFKMSGKIAASGNCNAIWNYQDLNAPLKAYCGYGMFRNCTSLTAAPQLPATTLANYCYNHMFYGCTSLFTAPKLPATTLANGCYYNMFYNCTSLRIVQKLPATMLAFSCYHGMFAGCTSLTAAPELPATTLVDRCYSSMFERCTSLTAAPELPATTLVDRCYLMMFRLCTKLNYIKCLATDISASNCTSAWARAVSSTGTFVKHPSMDDWSTSDHKGIPEGWTVVDAEI